MALYVIESYPYLNFSTHLRDKLIGVARVLLIGGRISSGKTFIANQLEMLFGYKTLHFASGVKNLAKQTGWDGHKDEFGRNLLQTIGGAGRRYTNGTLWAEQVYKEILETDDVIKSETVFIVDDFRYPEEYYYLASRISDVYTLWVDAPFLGDNYNYNYWDNNTHESEKALQYFKLWNFVLVNSLDIEELQYSLHQLDFILRGRKNERG